MKGKRNPFVAREGIPWLILVVVMFGLLFQYAGSEYLAIPALLLVWLFAVFRDPRRSIPAVPLGLLSPVDGTVIEVGLTDNSVLGGEAHRVVIAIDSFGTYTARSPVEGKIMDFRGDGERESVRQLSSGLWIQTDEGDDVVLQFKRHRFGIAPLAFLRFGERIGQGQRCAYLRLTRIAELQFPIHGRLLVEPGQRVIAGCDILGNLPPH
jgi:phosphatidylserine decarboxylase